MRGAFVHGSSRCFNVFAALIFVSPDVFPIEFLHSASNVMVIKVRDSQARSTLKTSRRAHMRSPSFTTRIWTVSWIRTG